VEQQRAFHKRPISVLDAGCGTGYAMSQLKERFGSNVRLFGLNIASFPSLVQLRTNEEAYRKKLGSFFPRFKRLSENFWRYRASFEKVSVGPMETHSFGGKTFDVIISAASIGSSFHPVQAVQNLLSHLNPRGVAVLDVFDHSYRGISDELRIGKKWDLKRDLNALQRELKQKGFSVSLANDVLVVRAP
jgi:SAM-dependent methyltransferase